MENKQINNKDAVIASNMQELIAERKRRKLEDEKEFLQEINMPEHQPKMEAIRGKIIRSETTAL